MLLWFVRCVCATVLLHGDRQHDGPDALALITVSVDEVVVRGVLAEPESESNSFDSIPHPALERSVHEVSIK